MPRVNKSALPALTIACHIHAARGRRVMTDAALAEIYGVTTGNINLAVRRNKARFPPDFMFVLTKSEADSLILQSAISKNGRGGRRHLPYVFTELGVAMLSSVLASERAVQMNIGIMRTFVQLRDGNAHRRTLPSGSKNLNAVMVALHRSLKFWSRTSTVSTEMYAR
jgi:hypothetical protein